MIHLSIGLTALLLAIVSCNGFIFDVKTDCLISPWSGWAKLPGLDMHIRERGILRHDFKGGSPCPPNDELRQVKTDNITGNADIQTDRLEQIQATAKSISANFLRRNPANSTEPGHVRDLLIVLDSSANISIEAFNRTKHNLVELLGMLCPDPDPFGPLYNHVALIDFSSSVVEVFDFNTNQSSPELKHTILSVPHVPGEICTTEAIVAAIQMLTTMKGMRSDSLVEKEVLILTDGRSNCDSDVFTPAFKLQSKATVFTMMIGNYTRSGMHEMISQVTTPAQNHLFAVKTLDGFDQLIELLQTQNSNDTVQCQPFDLPPSSDLF